MRYFLTDNHVFFLFDNNPDLTRGTKCTASNERFGATAAGSADLKGSAVMPPLTPSRPSVKRKRATARWGKTSDLKNALRQ
jgi:hypothetical protein